MLEVVREAI